MSETGFLRRLGRDLGAVWPSQEQNLILQAIFAPPQPALAAFATWRAALEIEQSFDHAVMRLLPLLYLRMQALGLEDPLMARLKGVYRRAWSDTHALFYGTAPALAALHAAGIETLLLKGAPMALCHYRNHGARPMADLDIAVHFADAQAALQALEGAGWQPDSPARPEELTFRHALSLRGPEGHEMDLHWHMLFESAGPLADAPFWANTQPLTFRDIPTLCLTPTLNLLHTLAHGLRPNAETPIRWIADAVTLLRDPTATIDWPLFCQTAGALGLNRRVLLALEYLQQNHGQEIPPVATQALRATRRTPAEALELAVMAPHKSWSRPAAFDRCLLLTAEFCRRAQPLPPLAALAMFPDFVRYRLGIASWRGAVRGGLRRAGQGLRQAFG
jgi:hypothetical protein